MVIATVVDALDLREYRYFHSTRAELLSRAGEVDGARAAYREALARATTDAERRFLRRRLADCRAHDVDPRAQS
jgi:RNA polymerase sigma-70 factor (ECF subfamily)